MTCIPIPAPPGGTIWVIFSSGTRLIRSKKRPISECSVKISSFMFANSALPGTNMGSTYCFSCFGFSQLYSITPFTASFCSISSTYALSFPVSFTMSSRVLGLRLPIFSASSAISSVQRMESPIYSGDSFVIFSSPSTTGARSVIIFASFAMGSRKGSSGCGLGNRESAIVHLLLISISVYCFSALAIASLKSL